MHPMANPMSDPFFHAKIDPNFHQNVNPIKNPMMDPMIHPMGVPTMDQPESVNPFLLAKLKEMYDLATAYAGSVSQAFRCIYYC